MSGLETGQGFLGVIHLGQHLVNDCCADGARVHAVAAYTVTTLGTVQCYGFGQQRNGRLGGVVAGQEGIGLEYGRRRQVDDRAAMPLHGLHAELAAQKNSDHVEFKLMPERV